MEKRTLIDKTLSCFVGCVFIIIVASFPIYYWITKGVFSDEVANLIKMVKSGHPHSTTELQDDLIKEVLIQFFLLSATLVGGCVLTMNFIMKRFWKPFDETLEKIEAFRLERNECPVLQESNIEEFDRLNITLKKLMEDSLLSYRAQKEFVQNASHELQTPLAIFQSKLDLMLQQPELTENQAIIIQDLYRINARLTRLNKNLLMLAKIENNQFKITEKIDLVAVLDDMLPHLESIAGGLTIKENIELAPFYVVANRTLLETMVNNLVVNAVRHNKESGEIIVTANPVCLIVANTSSNEEELDYKQIFNRFYRPDRQEIGNGLGLAIVKAVCDYHGWDIRYKYKNGMHEFVVDFK